MWLRCILNPFIFVSTESNTNNDEGETLATLRPRNQLKVHVASMRNRRDKEAKIDEMPTHSRSNEDESFTLNLNTGAENTDLSASSVWTVGQESDASLQEPESSTAKDQESVGRNSKKRERGIPWSISANDIPSFGKETRGKLYETLEEYTTRKGQFVPKKTLDLQYDCKCRMQCSENLSDDERKNSLESFQELDWLSQEQVILKTRRVDSNQYRNYSRVFHIANERVCKKCFLRRLEFQVKEWIMRWATKRRPYHFYGYTR